MRIDEIYVSVQGEGPRVGWPTIFVRFGGCNLRCPGWPCDTQHAIDPAFRSSWVGMTPSDVFETIIPMAASQPGINICLTGGEPFLQPTKDLKELVTLLEGLSDVGDIECFSNGTLTYPDWAFEKIKFVMDWKLPGSGEDSFNDVRLLNLGEMGEDQSVKFTIASQGDFITAVGLWNDYIRDRSLVQVFYGAVWGKLENAELIDWVLKAGLPWRFQMQVHNYVWDRSQRGI